MQTRLVYYSLSVSVDVMERNINLNKILLSYFFSEFNLSLGTINKSIAMLPVGEWTQIRIVYQVDTQIKLEWIKIMPGSIIVNTYSLTFFIRITWIVS